MCVSYTEIGETAAAAAAATAATAATAAAAAATGFISPSSTYVFSLLPSTRTYTTPSNPKP